MSKPDKLPMRTTDLADENFAKLAEFFPNAVTETLNEDGDVVRAVDADVLAQEINTHVLSGPEERYQFTWPDKRRAVLLANAPVAAALRPCREESVDFDNTENLYIEGDNLDVLKLLRETYLNRVKMIYIDPPYNTGNDFVYNDDFAEDASEFLSRDGQYDEGGNRMVRNLDSNGRFHTDWLNMIYPRLRVARDLLTPDGVICVSIDDNEVAQLRKVCDEVFGEGNFRNQITIRRGAKSVQAQFDTWDKLGQDVEHILFYTKNPNYRFPKQIRKLDEKRQGSWNNHWRGTDRPTMRYEIFGITPESGQWRWGRDRSLLAIENYKKMLEELNETEDTISTEQIDDYYIKQSDDFDLLRLSKTGKSEHYIPPTDSTLLNSSWQDMLVGSSSEILDLFGTKVFDTAKLTSIVKRMMGFCDNDSLILDFFSGSATTAHAVMQLNAEEKLSVVRGQLSEEKKLTTENCELITKTGGRRFIMVQIPEPCDEKSEAYKAGYKNICEIGKERIRRAGERIVSSSQFSVIREEMKQYGCVKLPRFDCLAESDGANSADIQIGQEATAIGNVFSFESNAEGCGVDSVEHSRRSGQEFRQGVCQLSFDSQGIKSRIGDPVADMRQSGLPCRYGYFGSITVATGNRENTECPHFKTENCPLKTENYPDIGFRVLKLDSSNMKDVYYTPDEYAEMQFNLDGFIDNIKEDRTAEDLLFQVMLDLGIPLSANIKQDGGIYSVQDGYLLACFGKADTDRVTAIAKLRPHYAVFRDSSFSSDSAMVNFEQVFNTYSPSTIRRVL